MILQPVALAVKHAILPSAAQSMNAFTASALSQNMLSAATLLRGGGKAIIDFDRAGLRLESLGMSVRARIDGQGNSLGAQ